MPKAKVNYALAATLLASGVTLYDASQRCGAKNADTLRVGLSRRGVTPTAIKRAEGNLDRITAVAKLAVSKASEELRDDFSQVLANHTAALKQIKSKPNLKHIKAVGDALEPLARTAKIVHGWGSEGDTGLISRHDLVEIEASCVPEPTISSVPVPSQLSSTPQVTQAIEHKPDVEQSK